MRGTLPREPGGVPLQVLGNEALYEVVPVVITLAHAQIELLAGLFAGRHEELGLELLGEEFVRGALVDADYVGKGAARDELGRIVVSPRGAVRTEIPGKCLLAPGNLRRRADRRERGHGLVARRILERDGQRAMS